MKIVTKSKDGKRLITNDTSNPLYGIGVEFYNNLKNVKSYNDFARLCNKLEQFKRFELVFVNNWGIPVQQCCNIDCYKDVVWFYIPYSSRIAKMQYKNLYKHIYLREKSTIGNRIEVYPLDNYSDKTREEFRFS